MNVENAEKTGIKGDNTVKLRCHICGIEKELPPLKATEKGWTVVSGNVDNTYFEYQFCPEHDGEGVGYILAMLEEKAKEGQG